LLTRDVLGSTANKHTENIYHSQKEEAMKRALLVVALLVMVVLVGMVGVSGQSKNVIEGPKTITAQPWPKNIFESPTGGMLEVGPPSNIP